MSFNSELGDRFDNAEAVEAVARAMWYHELTPEDREYNKSFDVAAPPYWHNKAVAAIEAYETAIAEAGMPEIQPSASARFAKHVKDCHPGGRIYEIEMVGIQSLAAGQAIEEAYRDGFNARKAAPDQR